MSKMPAIQFYPADWRKDIAVQSLTYEQKGIWIELLCIMHETEERGRLVANGLPIPCHLVARWLLLDVRKFDRIMSHFLVSRVAFMEPNTKIIYNKRMVEDERVMKLRREAGRKGGNPFLVNQRDIQEVNQKRKQNPTPSSSASSSSSNKLSSSKVFEFLRSNTNPKFISDRQIEKEVDEFIEKYEGMNIGNLKALCLSWVSNIIPEKKKMVVI